MSTEADKVAQQFIENNGRSPQAPAQQQQSGNPDPANGGGVEGGGKKAEQPAATAFDWSANTDGIIKSPDEVRPVIDRYKKLIEQEPLLDEISSPFANPEIEKYNGWVKATGITNNKVYETVSAVQEKGAEGLSPIDALVLRAIIKTPSLADKIDAVKAKFEKEYGVNAEKWREEDAAYTPMLSDIDLDINAQEAREYLGTNVFEKIKNTGGSAVAQRQKAIAEATTQWEEFSGAIAKQPAVPITLATVEGQDPFTITIPNIKDFVSSVGASYARKGIALSEQTAQDVLKETVGKYISQNIETILKQHEDYLKKATLRGLEVRYNNPTSIEKQAAPGAQKQTQDLAEFSMQKLNASQKLPT